MRLVDLLASNAIIAELESHDKRGVLQEFAALAQSLDPQLNADTIFNILQEREQLGSTAVGNHVAIPHGKVIGLNRIIALFGRSSQGIEFNAHDNKPTHIFFVLLAPESAIGQHLQALARLSRLVKDADARDRFLKCDTAELYNVLLNEDSKLG